MGDGQPEVPETEVGLVTPDPKYQTVVREVKIPTRYSPRLERQDPILDIGEQQAAALSRIAWACEQMVEYARLRDRQADVYLEKAEEQLLWTKVLSLSVLCTPIIAVALMALLG